MADGDLISVSELVELLVSEGFSVSIDSLQRLRDKGLIAKGKSLGRKGYAYRASDVERIRKVLIIQRDLGKKWSFEELAFWVAAHKLQPVPPKLVADYIASSVQSFLGAAERLAQRTPRGAREQGTPAERMAQHLVKGLFRIADPGIEASVSLARDIFTYLIEFWYFRKPLSKLAGLLKRIVYAAYDPSVADEQFFSWQDWLASHASMLMPSFSDNRLGQAVKKAMNKDSGMVVRAASDGLKMVMLVQRSLDPVPMPDIRVSKTDAHQLTRMARAITPLFAAISVDVQLDNPRNPLLLQLRSGKDLALPALVNAMMQQASQSSDKMKGSIP